jgi:hypothetical protein
MKSFFTASTTMQVNSGASVRFWVDWWNDQRFITMFEALHTYTAQPEISVAKAMDSKQWELHIRHPLSLQAQSQL